MTRTASIPEERSGRGRLRAARVGLVGAAAAQLAVAGLHFAMPSQWLGRPEFSSLPPAAHDFVTLGVIAVGVLLAGMAALAITAAVAARSARGPAAAIALIQAVVWVARAGLEVPLPLREPVLFLSEPSGVVMMGSLVLAAVLGISGLGLLSEPRRR
jgi:hypothetical protein